MVDQHVQDHFSWVVLLVAEFVAVEHVGHHHGAGRVDSNLALAADVGVDAVRAPSLLKDLSLCPVGEVAHGQQYILVR